VNPKRYWSKDARQLQFQWMVPGSRMGDAPTIFLRAIYDPTKFERPEHLVWQLEKAFAQMLITLKEEINQERPDAPDESNS
jgi:hypothetical protein